MDGDGGLGTGQCGSGVVGGWVWDGVEWVGGLALGGLAGELMGRLSGWVDGGGKQGSGGWGTHEVGKGWGGWVWECPLSWIYCND